MTSSSSYRLRVLVSAALGLLVSALLLLFLQKPQSSLNSRTELQLDNLVESLIKSQTRENEILRNKTLTAREIISRKFDWLLNKKSIPNHFLQREKTHVENQVIVFLHLPRTAGSALRNCLKEIGNNLSLILFPELNDEHRTHWDDVTELTRGYREGFDGHVGLNAFGLCDQIRRPCSYFTVMRRPLERAISSYFHCRQSLGDPMCNAVNANEMDLHSWVIFQGSIFFRSLLFHSSRCRDENINSSVLEFKLINSKNIPCWLKHKLWFDGLSEDDHRLLLDYVISQLEEWFAVFGVTEDLKGSLEMLEHAYNLPFTKCKSVIRKEPDKWVNAVKENSIRADYNAPLNYEDYVELQYDYRVQKALYADYKLYEKLTEIVKLQRRVVFNTL